MIRKRFAIAFLAASLAGCNAQDAATLGRIGGKLQERAEKTLLEDPNGNLVRTLPFLLPPKPSGNKPVDENPGVRASIPETN